MIQLNVPFARLIESFLVAAKPTYEIHLTAKREYIAVRVDADGDHTTVGGKCVNFALAHGVAECYAWDHGDRNPVILDKAKLSRTS